MSWYIWGVTSFDVPLLLDQSLICMKFSRYIQFCKLLLSEPMEMERFELLTPCLQGRCSPNWATPPFKSGIHLLSHAVSSIVPVSYTHLDVYKRQIQWSALPQNFYRWMQFCGRCLAYRSACLRQWECVSLYWQDVYKRQIQALVDVVDRLWESPWKKSPWNQGLFHHQI